MNRPCRLVLLPVAFALAGVTSCAGLAPLLEGTPERRPSTGPAAPASTGAPANAEVRDLMEIVNRYRRSKNLPSLTWHARAAAVAQAHSEDMARRGYFSHENPDGETPFDRMQEAGIRYRAAAENIAEGQETADEVFRSWVNSPGHRRNLDNPAYTHHGIGLHRDHWTHVLIRPR